MAITDLPTFTVNGVLSSDYGIYVLRTNDEDFPERDYETVEIPNRTGNLILDNGRWKNKNVVYKCVCFDSPSRNVPRFIGVFTKAGTDVRIEDTIHSDYMKLGKFKGGTQPKFKPYKTAATFDLVFDCDPRKWDISGEETGYNVWYDTRVDGNVRWNMSTIDLADKLIAPRFQLREIDTLEFGISNNDTFNADVTWRTIVKFNRRAAAQVIYDTETLHAYLASTGASIDDAIATRYIPKIGDTVCPVGNYKYFYIRNSQYTGATSPSIKINMRAYSL